MSSSRSFLSEQRLLVGPWQSFERDIARLFLQNGFEDVRLIGGSGDKGGDVLAVKRGEIYVAQCKFTSTSSAPLSALDQIVEAGKYYGARQLVVALSRPPSESFLRERLKHERNGLRIEIYDPPLLMRLMSRSPEYSPARRHLHVYQEDVSEKLVEALLDSGRGQIVLATGLGKTVVMAETVASLFRAGNVRGGKVLVLAHTKELVRQLHRSFWFQLPSWIPTHQLSDGEMPAYWDGVTFATIQSVLSRINQLPEFGLVLVDEAHHVGSQSFLSVLEELSPPMLGGATATPWRGDGYNIDHVLGLPVAQMGIADGLRQGFLCDVDYRIFADNLDWEVVQEASHNNYSIGQLNKLLLIPTRDEKAARVVWESFRQEKRRTGIVFSPTIIHAKSFAAMLRQFDLKAEAISSETPPREQDAIMAKFRAGQLDFITTVDLFNEGVDVPDVDTIVFMRATHSRRIFVQQIGRGLRISPTKEKVLVLDFVSDLRRIAEVIKLDSAVRGSDVERLGLGRQLVQFTDVSAGTFMKEWMLDQADLFLRGEDPSLTLPQLDFPEPRRPGNVE